MVHPHPARRPPGRVAPRAASSTASRPSGPSHHGQMVTRVSPTTSESPSVGTPAARASASHSADCSPLRVRAGEVVVAGAHRHRAGRRWSRQVAQHHDDLGVERTRPTRCPGGRRPAPPGRSRARPGPPSRTGAGSSGGRRRGGCAWVPPVEWSERSLGRPTERGGAPDRPHRTAPSDRPGSDRPGSCVSSRAGGPRTDARTAGGGISGPAAPRSARCTDRRGARPGRRRPAQHR